MPPETLKVIEWVGTLSGVIAVALSIREKVLAWPLFIVCYLIYAGIGFVQSTWAFTALNLIFVPIAVYGWWKWSTGGKTVDIQPVQISRLPPRLALICLGILVTGTVTLGSILTTYVQGPLPWLEAFATTFALLAQWMLSRKYIETWPAWIVSDLAFIILFGYQKLWPTVGMFTVFIALAIYGIIQWKSLLHSGHATVVASET